MTPTTADAAGAPDDRPGAPAASREAEERAAAWRRSATARDALAHGDPPATSMAPTPPPARRATHDPAFRALADNVRDYAIFRMDPAGVITYWGEGARLMKWWAKEEAEGGHLRLLYPDGGSEDGTAEAHLEGAAAHGEYTGEGQRVRRDGSTFWADVTLTALRDDEGTLLGFAKVTRDLTARRAAEAALRAARDAAERAQAAAEEANAAKSGFLATMSHEIRTPINAILGYHDLLDLEVEGTLTEGQRRMLERARASGHHLLGLIEDVLDFSRIDAKRVTLRHAAGRLGDVVTAALDVVGPQAAARGLRLDNAVSGHAATVGYEGDEARVRQVLVNLLSNAVKFTPPGGTITVSAGSAAQAPPRTAASGAALKGSEPAEIRVAGASGASGPWAYVRIEDTGVGIAAMRLAAVFEPFVQADMSHTRRHGGSGLGLAISRQLARLMGGDLTVESTEGVGSVFTLWLPLGAAASVEQPAAGPEWIDPAAPGAGASSPPGGPPAAPAPAGARAESAASNVAPVNVAPVDHAADPSGERSGPPAPAPSSAAASSRGPGQTVSDVVQRDMGRILYGFMARLRSDPGVPSARRLDAHALENHAGAFLADLAAALAAGATDEGTSAGTADAGTPEGPGDEASAAGAAVLWRFARQHGRQRARLGWSAAEVHREFAILGEEIAAALARGAPRAGPAAAEARAALTAFLGRAETASVAVLAEGA